MLEEGVAKISLEMLVIDRNQSAAICILVGLIFLLYALHFIETHYANKRIAVLEEEMKKLGEEEKGKEELN